MDITRKEFLKGSAALPLTALTAGVPASAQTPINDPTTGEAPDKTDDKPNVLLIMTDQHRPDLMTAAGRDLVPTPEIDRIAERGVRFERAYCPYPVCAASRMSLLTGKYAHTHGTINNDDRLDWKTKTVAHHFNDHGYLTSLIGKMHFNNAFTHGFEYYMSINDWLMYLGPKVQHYANEIANHPIGPHFYNSVNDSGSGFPDMEDLWPTRSSPWAGKVEKWNFDSMASPLASQDHLDSFIARQTVDFINTDHGRPFFLVCSFMKPHPPFYPPKKWADDYPVQKMTLPDPGDLEQKPPNMRQRVKRFQRLGEKRLKAHRAGYLGNLAFVDGCVGQVYRALEKSGKLENTIVIYTADHGEMDGDHGLFQKFCLYESSVGVPLIVSWPKTLPQNKVSKALTEYLGIFPTLAELTGTGPAKDVDAKSFAQHIRNPDRASAGPAFCEFNLKKLPQYMIRTDQYKLIYTDPNFLELYDHHADPGETKNLALDAGNKKKVNQLKDQLFAWYQPDKSPYRPKNLRG